VSIVVPSRWRHEYASSDFAPAALPGLEGRLRPLRVALRGRAQRHFHLARVGRVIDDFSPDAAFLEAEAYGLVAIQWAVPLVRREIPFGVQAYENIDRTLPPVIPRLRSWVLRHASFVAARSETAAGLVRGWGARGEIALVPPPVPGLDGAGRQKREARHFTVGFAGRLVAEKGLADLVAAVRKLDAPVELLLIGNGELRDTLDDQPIPGSRVQVVTGLSHEEMLDAYARMDVLVLPSRTTATWKEQFGRVIVEALAREVPVVGSDSGEIPWVIGLTGGGEVFPEGDVDALADRLNALRADPDYARALGARGRKAAARLFTVPAVTDKLEAVLRSACVSRS
jgi:glycosyltransferase involved in cell wall biosynthesis